MASRQRIDVVDMLRAQPTWTFARIAGQVGLTRSRVQQIAREHGFQSLYHANAAAKRICECGAPKYPAYAQCRRCSGLARRKSHCKWGHPLTDDNLDVAKQTGYRRCKACARWYHDQYKRRKANEKANRG